MVTGTGRKSDARGSWKVPRWKAGMNKRREQRWKAHESGRKDGSCLRFTRQHREHEIHDGVDAPRVKGRN